MEILTVGTALVAAFFLALSLQWAVLAAILRQIKRDTSEAGSAYFRAPRWGFFSRDRRSLLTLLFGLEIAKAPLPRYVAFSFSSAIRTPIPPPAGGRRVELIF